MARPYRPGGWLGKRASSLDNAMYGSPAQQLMRENQERARRKALDDIKDAEARKAAEGDTDANHDNDE